MSSGQKSPEEVHQARVEGGKKAAETREERYGGHPGLEKAQEATRQRTPEEAKEIGQKAADTRAERYGEQRHTGEGEKE